MNSIYYISIGKHYDFSNLSFSLNSSSCMHIIHKYNELRNILENIIPSDISIIHIIVEEDKELYILLSYYLRLLYPHIKLVCVYFADGVMMGNLEYFNHLKENNDGVLLEQDFLQDKLYDEIIMFNSVDEYVLVRQCTYLQSGKMEVLTVNYPSHSEMDSYIKFYIQNKLDNYMKELDFKNMEVFLRYIGIDKNHLRENLHNDQLIHSISDKEYAKYNWDDVYGKNPKLNIQQYLKRNEQKIKEYFNERQDVIISRIKDNLLKILKSSGTYYYIYSLDIENTYSLYQLIKKEKEIDINHILELNKKTYSTLKEKHSIAKNAHGLFSNKEEKLGDVFQYIDLFVSQMYEINRFKAMEKIYDETLVYLKTLNMHWDCMSVSIPLNISKALDNSNLYEQFIEEYVEIRDINCYQNYVQYEDIYQQLIFNTLSNYDYQVVISKYILSQRFICNDTMLDNQCIIGIKKENIQFGVKEVNYPFLRNQRPVDISLIIKAIQSGCLTIFDHKASVAVYNDFKKPDMSFMSIMDVLNMIEKMKSYIPEIAFYKEKLMIEDDYKILLEDTEFMESIRCSLEVLDDIKKFIDELEDVL